jgi:hypothetical protein
MNKMRNSTTGVNGTQDLVDYMKPQRVFNKIPSEFLNESYKIKDDILNKKGFEIQYYNSEVFILLTL